MELDFLRFWEQRMIVALDLRLSFYLTFRALQRRNIEVARLVLRVDYQLWMSCMKLKVLLEAQITEF